MEKSIQDSSQYRSVLTLVSQCRNTRHFWNVQFQSLSIKVYTKDFLMFVVLAQSVIVSLLKECATIAGNSYLQVLFCVFCLFLILKQLVQMISKELLVFILSLLSKRNRSFGRILYSKPYALYKNWQCISKIKLFFTYVHVENLWRNKLTSST